MPQNNIDFKTALEIIPRTTVFTTHTPVAAGHDEFPLDLVRPYLDPFVRKSSRSRWKKSFPGDNPLGHLPTSRFPCLP